MFPLLPALSSISLPNRSSSDSLSLVRPDGLPVRTGRTERPKPTDSRLLLIPKLLPHNLRLFSNKYPLFINNRFLSAPEKSFFDFTLPSSLFRSECLYLLGFTDGRENKHPSRLPPVQGPLFQNVRERALKREGNGRDIHFPSRASNALYIGI